jgi:phosphoglycolate phosphatase
MTAAGATVRCFDVGGIAFDLDGTLLDTIHDLAAAVNVLLAELGYPPLPKVEIAKLVGKGVQNLVRRSLALAFGVSPAALEDAEVDAALARYYTHYAALLGRETELYPGVLDGLQRIAALGIPMAVITNKSTRFVRPHLDLAGLTPYFSVLVGGDDLPRKKPAPDPLLYVAQRLGIAPAQLLMVGDSVNDAQAARAAGCPVVIVPYGYNEGEPVHSIDADAIVPSLLAVADRVRRVEPQPTTDSPTTPS